MNLVLQLSPDTEAKLRDHAARSGKDPESLALEALEEKLTDGEPPSAMLPPDQWRAKFASFLASLPQTKAAVVDVRRETIYEGRGE